MLKELIPEKWYNLLEKEFEKEYFIELNRNIFTGSKNFFSSFSAARYEKALKIR